MLIRRAVVLAAILVVASAAKLSAQFTWNIETADPDGDAGVQIGMALDDFDVPHIIYLERETRDVRYATKDGPAWAIETVHPYGDLRGGTTVVITPEGLPAFSRTGLYWVRTGAGWTSEEAGDGFSPWYSTVAITPDGTIHGVSQWSWGSGIYSGFVDYVYRSGGVWSSENISSAPFIPENPNASVAVDSHGDPHLSVSPSLGETVTYRYKHNGSWTVDTLGPGSWTSIALDANDAPRISYYDTVNGDLILAVLIGGAWSMIAVDQTGDVGQYTSQVLREFVSCISYYDVTNGDLKYATVSLTSGIATSVVETAGDVGAYTSLAFDSGGRPHIAYYDATNGAVKYAVGEPATVSTESTTIGHVKFLFRAKPSPDSD